MKDVSAPVTDSGVEGGGCVFTQRIGTNGRVKFADRVVSHGCSANSGQVPASGVLEGRSKTNGQVETGVVLIECLRPNGHVKVASGVGGKSSRTNRYVIVAGGIVGKRI